MGFDTTSSNTGKFNGACIKLEYKIGRELLWLACRHHVIELLMDTAWKALFPRSTSPAIEICAKFKKMWVDLDHRFDKHMLDRRLMKNMGEEKEIIIDFAEQQLSIHQPRDDYRELLELTKMFLGTGAGTFKKPGASSRARWMAKAIYCIKIWLFRQSFPLTPDEKRGIPVLCCFILKVYLRAWFTAPSATAAAKNDLQLMQDLLRYAECPKTGYIYHAAATKLGSHLWYLGEHNVAMALYDPNVSLQEKREMVHAIKTRQPTENSRIRCKEISLDIFKTASLSHFCSKRTIEFWDIAQLPKNFLELDPNLWNDCEDFIIGKRAIDTLRVVNDCAERGVALVQSFSGKITKDENQLQCLLQVVENHRKQFPNVNRDTLTKS